MLNIHPVEEMTSRGDDAQVIDARDPLKYRSSDLEEYARDIAAHKGTLLLLNKADLLPPSLRSAWADYFDKRGVDYVFWSAKAAADALKLDDGAHLMPSNTL